MAWVYILQSGKTQRFYIGSTNDFARRLEEHQRGHTPSTREAERDFSGASVNQPQNQRR
jgi:predicted GIY-YIG superfamily endonuclease